MDTGRRFGAQFIVGEGLQETIKYLNSTEHNTEDLCTYLQANLENGIFSDLNDWLEK